MSSKKKQQEEINRAATNYDEMPYLSYPYQMTSPGHLAAVGTLFGVNPAPIETARVLELGSSCGGNIIPHAMKYPKAHFVGVDISTVQIDLANKHKEKLGLKNIEFKACSITDIDKSFGKFDYIICHGIISWVPEVVRDAIFEVSSKNLSENGIAYISYNTLPGWNMVRAARDLMLYHTKNLSNPNERVQQARLVLDFVNKGLEGVSTPYAESMKSEMELLSKQADHYLRHEHLEDYNHQYYLLDFLQEAKKHQLQYLADCYVSSMYLQNMPAKVVDVLKTAPSLEIVQNYMNYITNRRFSTTLLCHDSVKLTRNLDVSMIKKFNTGAMIFAPENVGDIDLNKKDEHVTFKFGATKEGTVGTASPGFKAILLVLSENINNPLSFDELTSLAKAKLNKENQNLVEADWISNAMSMLLKGALEITMDKRSGKKPNLEKPKVHDLALYQVTEAKYNWVTSLVHTPIGVDIFDQFAIKYMNGINNKKAIVDLLDEDITNQKLFLNKDNKPIEDAAERKAQLSLMLDKTIEKFSMNALLV